MTDLDALLDANAESWKPEPGDKLVGQLVKVSYIDGQFHRYPMYELLTDGGDLVAVHAFHTVLQNEIHDQNVVEGDRLGIKYLGKARDKDGREKNYDGYRVVIERGEGPRPPRPSIANGNESFPEPAGEATRARIISALGAIAPATEGGMDAVKKRWAQAGLPRVDALTEDDVAAADLLIAQLEDQAGEPF